MDSIKRTNHKKPIKKYHKMCTLETIAEEKELDNIMKNIKNVAPKREAISKTSDNNFTPFLSSWGNRSVKSQKMPKPVDIPSKGNLRLEYETLKNDYNKLHQLSNSEKLNKHTLLSRIEELEEECENLNHQKDESVHRLSLEHKVAEQMKIDYEFILETQNQTFKRREKELLEQIENCTKKIDAYTQTSVENGPTISCISTFEYEELSEKLESFEKQNKYLHDRNDVLESENRMLKKTIAEKEENSTSPKLHNNETGIIPQKPNLALNEPDSELYVGPKQMEINEEYKTKEIHFALEKWLPEDLSGMRRELRLACNTLPEAIHFSNDPTELRRYAEIIQALINLQYVIKVKLENENSGSTLPNHNTISKEVHDTPDERNTLHKTKTEIRTEFDHDNEDNDILDLLQTTLSQINNLYHIEKNNTENAKHPRIEGDSLEDVDRVTLEKDNKLFGKENLNLSDAEKLNNSIVSIKPLKKSELQNPNLTTQKLKLPNETNTRNYTNITDISTPLLKEKDEEIQTLQKRNEDFLENIEKLNKEKHSQQIEYDQLVNMLKERNETILIMTNERMKTERDQIISTEKIKQLKYHINYHESELKKLCRLFIEKINSEKQQNNIEMFKTNNHPLGKDGFLKAEGHIETEKHCECSEMYRSLETEEQRDNETEEFDSNILMLKKKLTQLIYENETLKEINSQRQDMKEIFINFKQTFIEDILQHMQELKLDIQETKSGFQQILKLVEKEAQRKKRIVVGIKEKMEEDGCTPKQNLAIKLEDTENIENQIGTAIKERNKDKCTAFIIKEKQSEATIERRMFELNYNYDDAHIKTNKIFQMPKGNNMKEESGRSKSQNYNLLRNFEPLVGDEFKKEDKWKLHRTREHDSRRNIDLTTSSEITESL